MHRLVQLVLQHRCAPQQKQLVSLASAFSCWLPSLPDDTFRSKVATFVAHQLVRLAVCLDRSDARHDRLALVECVTDSELPAEFEEFLMTKDISGTKKMLTPCTTSLQRVPPYDSQKPAEGQRQQFGIGGVRH
eukprot:TRINITY_DN32861_c0_g1_i1.p1 TRINITY_DN32861_c0_g1~~TRINITY_DN32861_c0_g1_i1.p1  ORF type:complete len:133 (-),score=1.35 TRINITY_DN32861_c0_g1_i1:537-935(-)